MDLRGAALIILAPLALFALYAVYWIVFRSGKGQ